MAQFGKGTWLIVLNPEGKFKTIISAWEIASIHYFLRQMNDVRSCLSKALELNPDYKLVLMLKSKLKITLTTIGIARSTSFSSNGYYAFIFYFDVLSSLK